MRNGGDAHGAKKRLRKLERKVEILEGKVDELSKKIEAQENEKKIEKIVSLSAEFLTILAGLIAMERGKRQMKVIKTVFKMLGAVSITAALITGNHLIAGGAVIFSGIAIGIEFAEWRK